MLINYLDNEIPVINVSFKNRLNNKNYSRGNQIKWCVDNRYIKLDLLGYENVAEVLTSYLLRYTDIDTKDYVTYRSCKIYEDGILLGNGCVSESYLNGSSEVTIKDLLDLNMKPLSIDYYELRDFLYSIIKYDIKNYLDRILCLDSITRNEDRHFANIILLYDKNTGKYKNGPIFDNGSSCMSDIITYPMYEDFDNNYKRIHAKPFRTKFEDQIYNVDRINIRYEEFIKNVKVTEECSIRAFEVIKRGLLDMEGISWVKC